MAVKNEGSDVLVGGESTVVTERFAVWGSDEPENILFKYASSAEDAIRQFAEDGDIHGVVFYAFPISRATIARGEVKTIFTPTTATDEMGSGTAANQNEGQQ